MRAYVAVTGTISLLIVVAHLLRVIDEGAHVLTDPLWVILTAVAAGLCVWALRLLRGLRHRGGAAGK